MKKKLAELQSQKDVEIFDLQTVLQDAMNIETKLHEDMVQLHTKHWATLLVLCVSFAWNVVQFRRRRNATLRSAETKDTAGGSLVENVSPGSRNSRRAANVSPGPRQRTRSPKP